MYASHGFLRSDIGDVDVLFHEGQFHLFHLVLPNHDYIAHAVSEDGLSWRRVKNALFVGEPGQWDDDMLWTMHVSADPDHPGRWRMFYTGLSRWEYGRVQRIGVAESDDLMHWERVDHPAYPLQASSEWYESTVDEGRHWVSFRDPFFYIEPKTGRRLLLAAGRMKDGPVVRRGCVAVMEEVERNRWEAREPLYHPGLYDDVEVPVLTRIGRRNFLLGSIREDVKVHYWLNDSVGEPFGNYFDNVLLPKGNYAARVCEMPDGPPLLFNFFTKRESDPSGREFNKRMLPPPKALVMDDTGRLRLQTYRQFDREVESWRSCAELQPVRRLFDNRHAWERSEEAALHVGCPSGYEAFVLPGEYRHFRVTAQVSFEGQGKCGMVLRCDDDGNGYYLSLDLIKGVAQVRAWGKREGGFVEQAFDYQNLQAGYFVSDTQGPWDIVVLCRGMYIEVAIDGFVVLTLVNDAYHEGQIGFYTESAGLRVDDLAVQVLRDPKVEEHGPLCQISDAPQPALAGVAGDFTGPTPPEV